MATLAAGVRAPEFTLSNAVQGQGFSLSEALSRGPVVLAFFKTSCPVCQFAAPYVERLYQANRGEGVTIVGISQDNAKKTKNFLREYGVTFRVVLDDPERYEVSNAYGLTNVPSFFYVAPSGEIEVASVGWSKDDIQQINQKLAARRQQSPAPLWRPGEDVPVFRPG